MTRGDKATPALPAHLLASSNVCRMCLLAQRLDDRHLGKVLHRLAELRQGTAPVAFATFDVLGLRFWGGIWGIQAEKHIRNVGFEHSRGWFVWQNFERPAAGQTPVVAPWLDQRYPHPDTGPDGWNWCCSLPKKAVTKCNLPLPHPSPIPRSS